jgi:hypothetical protein
MAEAAREVVEEVDQMRIGAENDSFLAIAYSQDFHSRLNILRSWVKEQESVGAINKKSVTVAMVNIVEYEDEELLDFLRRPLEVFRSKPSFLMALIDEFDHRVAEKQEEINRISKDDDDK